MAGISGRSSDEPGRFARPGSEVSCCRVVLRQETMRRPSPARQSRPSQWTLSAVILCLLPKEGTMTHRSGAVAWPARALSRCFRIKSHCRSATTRPSEDVAK